MHVTSEGLQAHTGISNTASTRTIYAWPQVLIMPLRGSHHLHRLEAVRAGLGKSEGEDPLDNEEAVQEQMDSLPYLCRFQYEETAKFICGLMDPLIAEYVGAAGTGALPDKLTLQEGQLAWLTHIIAAVLRGRLSTTSAESQASHPALDGHAPLEL